MKTMRKKAAGLFLTVCACTMLVGCGNRDNTTTTKETTAAESNAGTATEKNSASRNNTASGKATGNKTTKTRTASDNSRVNSATAGRETNANGSYRESGMEEIGDGIGEVGEGIIHGAEDIADDITGNGPAERNNTTRTTR